MLIGSMCSGYGGLDAAVQAVIPSDLAWVADPDPGAAKILTHHHPHVPNLGDITTVDWAAVPEVDILTAGFPCFIAGTMILTSDGYRPIEDLAVGDLVLTHTGSWKPVTSVMSRDGAPLWRVKAGNVITTTPEHPFYATTRGRKWNNTRRQYDRTVSQPEWVDAKDLKAYSHRVGHILPPVEEPDEADGAMWWLAGRYLADGYRQKRTHTGSGKPVNGDQGKVVIACGRGKEVELRERLQRAGLHATESSAGSVTKFILSGPRMYQFVADFGDGAHLKALPGRALALPSDLAEELLAGWLSGDGHREKSGWAGTTTSKVLALGMVLIAHRARGVVASLNRHVPAPTKVIEGRTVNQRPWWRIRIPANNRKGIVEGDRAWKFVTESEPVGLYGRVYNISVQGDESYLADGVVVHNCQDISNAGHRAGIEGTRSGIWTHVVEAVRVVRPRLVFLENVSALTSRGLDRVAADLAEVGFVGSWRCVRASDVGAPHRRERIFILAWPADAAHLGHQRPGGARAGRDGSAHGGHPASDALGVGRREGRTQPAGLGGGLDVALGGGPDWGPYGDAIFRWEHVTGRVAPVPTEPGRTGQPRLSPRFVEWLMGLPEGHVTGPEIGLTRNQQLKALGNGVVPQQGAVALRMLLERAAGSVAA